MAASPAGGSRLRRGMVVRSRDERGDIRDMAAGHCLVRHGSQANVPD